MRLLARIHGAMLAVARSPKRCLGLGIFVSSTPVPIDHGTHVAQDFKTLFSSREDILALGDIVREALYTRTEEPWKARPPVGVHPQEQGGNT